MDAQDRFWFAEYRGNKIGMFDTKQEKFSEWALPTAFTQPYDVTFDRNGELWTGGMTTDRVVRLDPKTGQGIEYPARARHQYAAHVRGQYHQPGHVLGRQQSRRFDRQGRAAG